MTELLREYLATYELAPVFTEEEILHYLMPVEGVIETHVVEGKGKASPFRAGKEHGCCASPDHAHVDKPPGNSHSSYTRVQAGRAG